MEALKMADAFIRIQKNNNITHAIEQDAEDVCSLYFLHLDRPELTHPDHWEMHPGGDELLLVTSGELDVEMVSQALPVEDSVPHNPERKLVTVCSGESLVIKKGHWHRIILKKETNLVVAGFRKDSKLAPVV